MSNFKTTIGMLAGVALSGGVVQGISRVTGGRGIETPNGTS